MIAALRRIALVLLLGLTGVVLALLQVSEACAATGPDVRCAFWIAHCTRTPRCSTMTIDKGSCAHPAVRPFCRCHEPTEEPCRPQDAYRLRLDGEDGERIIGRWRNGWLWRDLYLYRDRWGQDVIGHVTMSDAGRARVEKPRYNGVLYGRCE